MKITEVKEPAGLYCRYTGEHEPQTVHIRLDLYSEELCAVYKVSPGDRMPLTGGFILYWPIPCLTAEAALCVLEDVAPYAERILADWSEDNGYAVLGDDATLAESEIREILGLGEPPCWQEIFDDTACVNVWYADEETVSFRDAADFGLTALSTDKDLERIAAAVTESVAENSPSGVAVVEGLDKHLRDFRDLMRQD